MSRRRYVVHSFSLSYVDIEKLCSEISFLFHQVQVPIRKGSEFLTLTLHWKIGRLIVEYEQQQSIKDEDHQELLSQLSERLLKKFENRFSFSMLEECCKFYLVYPPLSKQGMLNKNAEIPQFQDILTWDHYRLLIQVSCPKARVFYEKETSNNNWSPSLLRHFIKSSLFERLSSSKNKESVLRSAQRGSLELFSVNNNKLNNLANTQEQ